MRGLPGTHCVYGKGQVAGKLIGLHALPCRRLVEDMVGLPLDSGKVGVQEEVRYNA